MKIYVAYNDSGDLIAEAYSYDSLVWKIRCAGYDMDEVITGAVTP